MNKWLPHILYGTDAIAADHKKQDARSQKIVTNHISDLPGGRVVTDNG
jgi:hypothetical protein